MKPYIGQQVLFWDEAPVDETDLPEPATICFIDTDGRVNVQVISVDGHARSEVNVPVVDDDSVVPRSVVLRSGPGRGEGEEPDQLPARGGARPKPEQPIAPDRRPVGGPPKPTQLPADKDDDERSGKGKR
jgi:hypothetical protein